MTGSTKPNGLKPTAPEDSSNSSANTNPLPNKASSSGKTAVNAVPGNQKTLASNAQLQSANGIGVQQAENEAPTINRKKQKRREKQAARLAAAEPQKSTSTLRQGQSYTDANDSAYQDLDYAMSATHAQFNTNGYDYGVSDYDDPDQYEPEEGEDLYYTDEDDRLLERPYTSFRTNGHAANDQVPPQPPPSKAQKKKRSKSNAAQSGYPSNFDSNNAPYATRGVLQQPPPPPPPPALSTAALRSAHHISTDRIWNTSTAEERERIKEFWLSLGEEDRRSLVKVEKEAVLKKMKEQQKHSCSCTVCGRKRTAIEEELEVLYDAYYEELEQYANHQQLTLEDGTPIIPRPTLNGRSSGRMPPGQQMPGTYNPRSSRGRIQEVTDDDEEEGEDDEYSDEDEDDDISEDEPPEPMGPAAEFFNFGNSLTVQGGILTVADDLLKNDGKKFIEMMEQLAERRMQREEEAQFAGSRFQTAQGHNHGPPLDEDQEYDEDDEEEDDDYSQEEDYDEEDEMEAMTEEQRMEEGRRMFQIFAARMFEQRVLTAYREKVARERQQKLIEELDEESRLDTQREAKRAKEAQKKKEKKRQQKQARDEEKAKRDAEKAAEEAALKAIEEKKLQEQRQKKEEQRKKKEAEKKAQEEERQRKEAEKLKRAQEAREHQAELERKQREQKERERKKREEAKQKEREERETKDKELREKKEREALEKKDREAKAKAEKDEAERKRKEGLGAKLLPPPAPVVPNLPSSKSNPMPAAVPQTAALQPPQTASSHASPHLPIAIPAVPKAPTPIRPRQASFHGSHNSSPKTSLPPSESSTNSSSVFTQPQNGAVPPVGKNSYTPSSSQPTQQTPPFTPTTGPSGPPSQPSGLPNPSGVSAGGFPATFGPMMPNVMHRTPAQDSSMFSHQPQYNGNQFRSFMGPNGLPYPPGMNGMNPMRPFPQGRGGPTEASMAHLSMGPSIGTTTATHNPGQIGMHRETMPSHSHSRQSSATFERSHFENPSIPAQANPIARPAPIQRPSSTAPQQQRDSNRRSANIDVDDLSNHLGSSALLDDTDVPLSTSNAPSRRESMAPGIQRSTRQGFTGSPGFQDPIGTAKTENFGQAVQIGNGIGIAWNSPQTSSSGPPSSGLASWPNAPRPGWPNHHAFGNIGGSMRSSGSRAVTIRHLICQACNKLSAHPPTDSRFGFHNIETVLRQVEMMKPANEEAIAMQEMLDICDTEGNSQNGGGSFVIENHEPNGVFVKFDQGRSTSMSTRGGGPGDIGSPVPGGMMPAFGGPRAFSQGNIMSSTGF